jgi:hypothetical protein
MNHCWYDPSQVLIRMCRRLHIARFQLKWSVWLQELDHYRWKANNKAKIQNREWSYSTKHLPSWMIFSDRDSTYTICLFWTYQHEIHNTRYTHNTHLESASERCLNVEAVLSVQSVYTTHIPMNAIIRQTVIDHHRGTRTDRELAATHNTIFPSRAYFKIGCRISDQ